MDLLNLARSSKPLRDILLSRSLVTAWKKARSNVKDLPDCPPDLDEPGYANLLFLPHCHFCFNAKVFKPMWRSRVRCCKACFDSNFVDMSGALRFLYPHAAETERPQSLQIIAGDIYNHRRNYLKARVAVLRSCLQDVGNNEEKSRAFEEQMIESSKAVEMHARLLEKWHYDQGIIRAKERDDIRTKRCEAIIQKLQELGYGDDLKTMDRDMVRAFFNHQKVKQPKQLTERVWENIKEDILQFVLHARAVHLSKSRCERLIMQIQAAAKFYMTFILRRPHTELLPSFGDFCMMPEVLAILGRPSIGLAKSFEDLSPLLVELSDRWHLECSFKLMTLLPASVKQMNAEDISPLGLATTWFFCSSCQNLVGFPRILIHACMNKCTMNGDGALDLTYTHQADVMNTVHLLFGEQPWHIVTGSLRFHQVSCSTITNITMICGKNPAVVTAREMDELDARFICLKPRCMTHGHVCVVTWRTAVLHEKIFHPEGGTSWSILNTEDITMKRSCNTTLGMTLNTREKDMTISYTMTQILILAYLSMCHWTTLVRRLLSV
ncbi:hypothetical protein SCP_0300840 [Sparassis crispa]|uniref:F-box domain-containing protein n=1 Tax=Sparassis crispa TaxID=139825 RepID=A0A401GDW9_9APHY|nr:hypothetical protein SCP_0300840 [Sparassis crispa]GBE80369.1 hypothetical protein SCP_0300840 [Sparassis crispa]